MGFFDRRRFLMIPGLGPVLVAGPVVGWIAEALEGAAVAGGLSVIGAGLYSIGIPKDSVLRYESALKAGKFVLVAHGTPGELLRAKDILRSARPEEADVHLANEELLTPVG